MGTWMMGRLQTADRGRESEGDKLWRAIDGPIRRPGVDPVGQIIKIPGADFIRLNAILMVSICLLRFAFASRCFGALRLWHIEI